MNLQQRMPFDGSEMPGIGLGTIAFQPVFRSALAGLLGPERAPCL
jgi:hypothetical protein